MRKNYIYVICIEQVVQTLQIRSVLDILYSFLLTLTKASQTKYKISQIERLLGKTPVHVGHYCLKNVATKWHYKLSQQNQSKIVSRKPGHKDVCRRTIEMLQRTRIFKVNCFLKVHHAHLKLASPISG